MMMFPMGTMVVVTMEMNYMSPTSLMLMMSLGVAQILKTRMKGWRSSREVLGILHGLLLMALFTLVCPAQLN
jgi:hypothetical protein